MHLDVGPYEEVSYEQYKDNVRKGLHIDEGSYEQFKDNVLELMPLLSSKYSHIIKAELYREIGDFEAAQRMIAEETKFSRKTLPEERRYIDNLIRGIKEHIDAKDSIVFQIKSDLS